MGLFSRHRDISKYITGVNDYLRKVFHYDKREDRDDRYGEKLSGGDPEQPDEIDYIKLSTRPRYSLEPDEERSDGAASPKAKYSLQPSAGAKEFMDDFHDRYDPETISRLLHGQIESRSTDALSDNLDQAVDQSFVDRVIALIRLRNVRDSVVYKAAQLDRRLFSKIMSDRTYKPSKDTAIAIALALQLPLIQANDLLSRAGYTLSHSSKRDVVIEYFFREGIYRLTDINIVLDKLGLKPIGR